VPNYFEMCDWVAMPYSRRFTSQSGVLNVAMAHHRPVLISGTPTVTAALRGYDVGVVIPPDDFHELYLGISEIYGRIQNENRWEFHQFLMANAWETNVQTADEAYRRVALMSV